MSKYELALVVNAKIEDDARTEVIEKIKELPTEHVYILATYTAVLQLRKELAAQGFIKGGMNRG